MKISATPSALRRCELLAQESRMRSRAFTLIEMLVSMMVLAVLGVAMVSLRRECGRPLAE